MREREKVKPPLPTGQLQAYLGTSTNVAAGILRILPASEGAILPPRQSARASRKERAIRRAGSAGSLAAWKAAATGAVSPQHRVRWMGSGLGPSRDAFHRSGGP